MSKEKIKTGGPNQKYISSTVKSTCDTKHYYALINLDAMHTAMLRLKGNYFRVWCYFAQNVTGYNFYLSSKDVCEVCQIGMDTYSKAINELITQEYLVLQEDGSYIFYDMPHNITLSENQLTG